VGTAEECRPLFGDPRYGGLNVLHPDRHDLDQYFAEVRGPGFGDVQARVDIALPEFPLTIPRVYPLVGLRGHLDGSFYAIGADKAIIERKFVLPADELREILDIWGNQKLALMLYGKDPHMEELWRRRHELIPAIAEAGYDFVSPPSFSARRNHPPPEYVYNAKRSLIYFELLQEYGAPTAPRLAWLTGHDADRGAEWWNAQPGLRVITLDLAIKHDPEWSPQLALLQRFDRLTDRRLTYLIHGPAAPRRLADLFSLLGPRLRLTGTRAIARPRRSPAEFLLFAAEEEALAQAILARVTSEARPTVKPAMGEIPPLAAEHRAVDPALAA
jgi:hypothetical protein